MVRAKDIKNQNRDELQKQVVELKQELAKEKATVASGTRSENPGKIRKLRRDVARILTVLKTKGEK